MGNRWKTPIVAHQNAKELDRFIIPFAAKKPIKSNRDYFRYYPEHDGYDYVQWCMDECGFEPVKYECFFKRAIVAAMKKGKKPVRLEWLHLLFWMCRESDRENFIAFYVSTAMSELNLKRLQVLNALNRFEEEGWIVWQRGNTDRVPHRFCISSKVYMSTSKRKKMVDECCARLERSKAHNEARREKRREWPSRGWEYQRRYHD